MARYIGKRDNLKMKKKTPLLMMTAGMSPELFHWVDYLSSINGCTRATVLRACVQSMKYITENLHYEPVKQLHEKFIHGG